MIKPEIKKKEIDNNQIAYDLMMKKNEMKKKPIVNVQNNPPNVANFIPQSNYNPSPNNMISPEKKQNSQGSKNNEDSNNPLKELMKKGREQLKNGKEQDVIWLGKDVKEKEKDTLTESTDSISEKKKEIKFPKIIIVEKPNSNPNSNKITSEAVKNEIDITNPKDDPRNIFEEVRLKEEKQAEDFYNLNRYLNELAKLEDEEENIETSNDSKNFKEVKLEYKPNETTDLEVPDEGEDFNNKKKTSQEDSDNSQIEMLRIELENTLGFDVFKKVYKTVDSQVRLIYL